MRSGCASSSGEHDLLLQMLAELMSSCLCSTTCFAIGRTSIQYLHYLSSSQRTALFALLPFILRPQHTFIHLVVSAWWSPRKQQGGALFGNDVLSLAVSDSTFSRNGHLRLTEQELEEFDGWPWVFAGGAIAVEGYEPVNVLLQRCRLQGNAAESGGGVSVTQWGAMQGRLRVKDCFFTHNEVGARMVDRSWQLR
jgi:hypothetical protein